MTGPSDAIAVVGTGCRYPDADGPDRLWETVLAGRRAFRPIPRSRLNPDDYLDDGTDPDRTYAGTAAVLDGWEFDRSRFRVPGPVHRAADPAHWLALEVAADTLADAGFPGAGGLDRDRVAVVIGNTMTGEVSRAGLMRLRWPYVRRVVGAALAAEGWDAAAQDRLLARIEIDYKAPFPEPDGETLAGGLANTIAGRVCNHFDLHGGGHTVDGACASSLLAVISGCSALLSGDADLVLAGGVDLSLDPFELVGFSRAGALATDAMRVYDAEPTGFWPGEGCGMVALMRAEDARAAGRTPLALIRGWGASSDGKGGITRPEADGQELALRRAYARAGFGPGDVALFEGHGTGTAVGDRAEIEALIAAHDGTRDLPPAAIGTVKANIGHTKAAAGVAGLIKAVQALRHGVVPPTTGCRTPHPLLTDPGAPLRVTDSPEEWVSDEPMRAAVSAMGFGGINTHVVLEAAAGPARGPLRAPSALDHEVFAVTAPTLAELRTLLRRIADRASTMSAAEHLDLAASLAGQAPAAFRAAIVARDPAELARRARQAAAMEPPATGPGVFLGHGPAQRVALLCTGQGAPVPSGAGALGTVCRDAARPFAERLPSGAGTAVAQPGIVRASLAGLRWLDRLGVRAVAAVGHSLGEITALAWSGALTEDDASRLAEVRGRVMASTGLPGTGMVSVAAEADLVAKLLDGTALVIAADNGAAQVVAGPDAELERLLTRARDEGIAARRLDVSHGFHSPALAPAVAPLAAHLDGVPVGTVDRPTYSTVTGTRLGPSEDVRALLARQVTSPVLFRDAVTETARACDLFVEVGPGHGLAALAEAVTGHRAFALDVGSPSAASLCTVAGALFAAAATDLSPLFAERFHRPFDLWREPVFLSNPCESVPERSAPVRVPGPRPAPEPAPEPAEGAVSTVVRALVAEALELPAEGIADRDRLLGDLHLNSLRIAQLTARAAAVCGRDVPMVPLSLADATVGEVIAVIEALPAASATDTDDLVPGVAEWHRVLVGEEIPAELPEDDGITVVLPEDPADRDVQALIEAARRAVDEGTPLTVLDHGDTASGFAGTVQAEHPELAVRYLRTGAAGAATMSRYRPLDLTGAPPLPFGPDDVALITGGGKGIGLETARALAAHGVRLALMGRSGPDHDAELGADLALLTATGADLHYESADVADARQVRRAVAAFGEQLGPVTLLIHCAGVNRPARFTDLEAAEYAAHAAPKHTGLTTVLAELDRAALRALVTYGSVIGRFGLPGEAHYALANGRMRETARLLAAELPGCQVLNIDWTAWSGAGMGQRLDVLDGLVRSGVVPLPAERGAELIVRLLAARPAATSVVVSGRLPALDQATARDRRHTPGVEIVTELVLTATGELDDHRVGGTAVVPAVTTLAAMTGAARTLTGHEPGAFSGLRWDRPLTVPDEGARTLRICALRQEDGAVDVVVRSDETGFAVDHAAGRAVEGQTPPPTFADLEAPAPAHEAAALYGGLFFHGPAFHLLRRYEHLDAYGCTAVLRGGPTADDATLHVLQGCVPHRRLLPVGCDRFVRSGSSETGELVVRAAERDRQGADYIYDVAVTDTEGRPVLAWHGLRLRDAGPLAHPGGLPAVLAGPYLQRLVAELVPGLRLRVGPGAASRIAGRGGRPAGTGRSHLDGLTLSVSGEGDPVCDWEEIGEPSADLNPWPGAAAEIRRLSGEPDAHTLTRLWTVRECLSKAGRSTPGPLTVTGAYEDGRLLLRAGTATVVSCVLALADRARPVAVSVLTGGER